MTEHDLFLSFARRDSADFVTGLAEALLHRGFRAWYDRRGISGGAPLKSTIEKAIDSSGAFVAVLSPNYFDLPWPVRELEYARRREGEGHLRVLFIWRGVDETDIPAEYGSLRAISTDDKDADAVATELIEATPRRVHPQERRPGYTTDLVIPDHIVQQALSTIIKMADQSQWTAFDIGSPSDDSPGSAWMLSEDPHVIETIHGLLGPLAYIYAKQYVLERSLTLLSRDEQIRFMLLTAVLRSFFEDDILAACEPQIAYTPRVPDWRQKRRIEPARYWWQGSTPIRFAEGARFLLWADRKEDTLTLIGRSHFATTYRSVFNGLNVQDKQAIGLIANAIFGWRPRDRPVFMRVLTTQFLLYTMIAEIEPLGITDQVLLDAARRALRHDPFASLSRDETLESTSDRHRAILEYFDRIIAPWILIRSRSL
ncbi:MAG: toll/interleukin-1 receptor domain-containing protein [Planctomycetota bacterium]